MLPVDPKMATRLDATGRLQMLIELYIAATSRAETAIPVPNGNAKSNKLRPILANIP